MVLENLKILDFTRLLPGPFGTMIMGDLGSDILRIEALSGQDLMRDLGPKVKGSSAYHLILNRNKRSLAVDLKTEEGRDLIRKLIKQYDIVVEGFRPGVMTSLGLDYNSLTKENPSLIYCSITGYGQNSSKQKDAGHDINYLAISGLASHSGKQNTGPVISGTQIADMAGSLYMVTSILAAYIYRLQTGKGQYIDLAMTDCAVNLQFFGMIDSLIGKSIPSFEDGLLNGGSYYNYYLTKDKRYISVGALEKKFFEILVDVVGDPELEHLDPETDGLKIKNVLEGIFKRKTLQEWVLAFEGMDACVEPVLHTNEALNSDYFISRGIIDQLVDDEITVPIVSYPAQFSITSQKKYFGGKSRGEDNKKIFHELNLDKSYEDYRDRKIIS